MKVINSLMGHIEGRLGQVGGDWLGINYCELLK